MMHLHDFLDHRARQQPDAPFALEVTRSGRRRLRYDEACAKANQLSHALRDAGCLPGTRVVTILKNGLPLVLAYFAASKAGAVLTPLNYRLTPADWAEAISDSGASVVVAGADFIEGLEPLRGRLPGVRHFVAVDAPPRPPRPGWLDFGAWLEGRPTTPPPEVRAPGDVVCQMYTSGTTGTPKGVLATHGNILASVRAATEVFGVLQGRRTLIVPPLCHAAAASNLFRTISWGGCSILHEAFVAADVLRAMREDAVQVAFLVPAMLQACLQEPSFAASDGFPALEHIVYGGSPIREETLRRAMAAFGCRFTQGYGMTEASGSVAFLSPEDHVLGRSDRPRILASAGRAAHGIELRICGPDGTERPRGTLGELQVRGPQIMPGYHRRDSSSKLSVDGWLKTGDLCRLDEDGYLFVHDRVDDLIVSGGENVSAAEVEAVLLEGHEVAEAAVIGIPDEVWGEAVCALVVVREGQPFSEAALMERCRARLAGFKRPKKVCVVPSLPRNASGKVLRRVLRAPYWADRPRQVEGA